MIVPDRHRLKHKRGRNQARSCGAAFQICIERNFGLSGIAPQAPEYKVITYQLIKSASSGGANYEEAQGSVSSADFSNKIGIALKEIREANYWIRLIIDISAPNEKWKPLLQESEELKKILGAIYSKTSKPR